MKHVHSLEQDPIGFLTQDLPENLRPVVTEVANDLGELVGKMSISRIRDMTHGTLSDQLNISVTPQEVTKIALAARLTALQNNNH